MGARLQGEVAPIIRRTQMPTNSLSIELDIVHHCATVNLLRIVNLLWRSILSTAGSFGHSTRKYQHNTPKIRFSYFFSIPGGGVSEGVFQRISFFDVGGYFRISGLS